MTTTDQASQIVSNVVNLEKPPKLKGTQRSFQSALRKAFHMFDADHSNTIDRDELAAMMRSLGKKPTERKVDAIFHVLDLNDDGEIDFAEFSKYFAEEDTEQDEDLYCMCQKPGKGFMIQCDAKLEGCYEWYHGACVNVKPNSKDTDGVWFCPNCKSKAPKKTLRKSLSGWFKIKGKRYDHEMIKIVNEVKGGTLDLSHAKSLVAAILDDGEYSQIEKDTMAYIRANYTFTPEADELIRHDIASHATLKSLEAQKQAEAKKQQEKEAKKEAQKEEKSSGGEGETSEEDSKESDSKENGNDEKAKPKLKKRKKGKGRKGKGRKRKAPEPSTMELRERKPKEEDDEDDKVATKKQKKTQAEEALERLTGEEQKKEGSTFAISDKKKWRRQLRKIFRDVDLDHSNTLDRLEVAALFKKLGRKPDEQKIEAIFTTLDKNGDGTIDFDEFLKYFQEKDAPRDLTPYCTCRQPHAGRFMLACDATLDGCLEWYHGECVGVKQGEEPKGAWFCPICKAKGKDQKHALRKSLSVVELLSEKKRPLKYDNDMLEIAKRAAEKYGMIRLEDAKALASSVLSDGQYSQVEKRTMRWIRQNYQFSIEADNWYRHEIASWASKKGHLVPRRLLASPASPLAGSPVRETYVNTPIYYPASPQQPVQPLQTTQYTTESVAPVAANVLTAFSDQQLQNLPYPVLSPAEEKGWKDQVDKWFETHSSEVIRKLTPEVKGMELKAVLSVAKEDWQTLTGNILSTVSIVTFLKQFQAMFTIYNYTQ